MSFSTHFYLNYISFNDLLESLKHVDQYFEIGAKKNIFLINWSHYFNDSDKTIKDIFFR